MSSLLVHYEKLNLGGSPKKGAKPYITNCLPLVVTSSSACQLWATALVLNTVLVGTSCISAFLTTESVPPVSQQNGSEGKMLR